MRLVHTSDWHLGRAFHGAGLRDAQRAFLDHLVDVVRSEQVDAVLVSGDVYDRALPSPDTVQLLDDALYRLLDSGAQVIISSGNHDSAARLGFGSRMLQRAGLHIRTTLESVGTPVTIDDTHIYPIPYLEPSLAAEPLGCGRRTHAAVLRAAMARIEADHAARGGQLVVMAHAFVTGATTSDSERDISVGGMGAVPLEVFESADYAALGHLHGAQQLSSRVRYCGSPVAMSFSETDHVKGSLLVDLGGEEPSVELVPAPVDRPLARLRGTLTDLLTDGSLVAAEDAWCQVTLTDATRPLGAMDLVRGRFPHTLQLLFDGPTDLTAARSYAQRVQGRSDLNLCCDFLEHVREGAAADDVERQLLADALESSAATRRAHDDEGGLTPRGEEGVA